MWAIQILLILEGYKVEKTVISLRVLRSFVLNEFFKDMLLLNVITRRLLLNTITTASGIWDCLKIRQALIH